MKFPLPDLSTVRVYATLSGLLLVSQTKALETLQYSNETKKHAKTRRRFDIISCWLGFQSFEENESLIGKSKGKVQTYIMRRSDQCTTEVPQET